MVLLVLFSSGSLVLVVVLEGLSQVAAEVQVSVFYHLLVVPDLILIPVALPCGFFVTVWCSSPPCPGRSGQRRCSAAPPRLVSAAAPPGVYSVELQDSANHRTALRLQGLEHTHTHTLQWKPLMLKNYYLCIFGT